MPPTTDDELLQQHLAECVECWETLAEQEERHGINLRLPPHPEMTTADARRVHTTGGSKWHKLIAPH